MLDAVWPRPVDASPADALRSLHDALERGDLAWVREELLSGPAAEAFSRWLEALARACSAVPYAGDAETVDRPLDGGGSVTLIREEGRWRVHRVTWPAH